jgi:hypothetical protein
MLHQILRSSSPKTATVFDAPDPVRIQPRGPCAHLGILEETIGHGQFGHVPPHRVNRHQGVALFVTISTYTYHGKTPSEKDEHNKPEYKTLKKRMNTTNPNTKP